MAAQKKRKRDHGIKIAVAICAVAIVAAIVLSTINPSGSSGPSDKSNGSNDEDSGAVNLGAVSLLSPQESSVIQSDETTLTWMPVAGADEYDLVIDEGPFSYLNISTTETHYPVSNLLDDERYCWEVAAVKDGQYGPFSTIWSFTVNDELDAPVASSPQSGSIYAGENPTLRWIPVSGASEYRVQVSRNANFSSVLLDVLTPSTNYQVNVELQENATYYWRVMAHQGSLWSAWSQVLDFYVGYSSFTRSFSWNYDGSAFSFTENISGADYYSYHGQVRDYNYASYVTDDKWVESTAVILDRLAKAKGYSPYQEAEFVLKFVQNIKYGLDIDTTGQEEYPRYPVETLVDQVGDCEDLAALYASLMQSSPIRIDAVLLELTKPGETGHMAVGIAGTDLPGTYFTYDGRDYYYCETTNPAYYIGDYPASGLYGYTCEVLPC